MTKSVYSDEVRQYLEEELNETDESRLKGIQEIRKWMEENPELHVNPEEKFILAFLRGCKFNLEKTKEKIKNHQELRRDSPEWFRNRNPLLTEIQELVRLGVFVPLKKLHNKQLVVVIRTAAHDPKRHKQDDVFKAGKMILDIAAMEYEYAQIFGVIAIFDMNGISLGHARQLTPAMIKKAVFAWQNYHCKPKGLEFINAPIYINVVLNIFKSFMSDKLKGRVQVHFNGFDTLHAVVSKDVLPQEYGGTGQDFQETIKFWHGKLMDYCDWFERDEQYKAE